jgi:hypothetical protein
MAWEEGALLVPVVPPIGSRAWKHRNLRLLLLHARIEMDAEEAFNGSALILILGKGGQPCACYFRGGSSMRRRQ